MSDLPEPVDMRQKNILIVDDDRQISEGAAVRLRAAGYDTLIAHNGKEGISKARCRRPDAILLDIRMPEMDGLAALNTLKNLPETHHIPVVIVSASVVDEEAALDGGARYFIRKPFSGRSLVDAIDAATSTPSNAVLQNEERQPDMQEPSRKTWKCESQHATEDLLDAVFALMSEDTDILNGVIPDQRPWMLCVDDDQDFSHALSRRLEAKGIGVLNAFDGMDGFNKAFAHPANAIVLDFNMPNGQGDYMLRRLKENAVTRDIPVIVLTGNRDDSVRRTMLALGADAFLYKPLLFEQLLTELEKHFDIPTDDGLAATIGA